MQGKVHRSSVLSLPVINPERLKTAKTLVGKAVKQGKVFSIQGPYPVVRAALWARGWVERRLPRPFQKAPSGHVDEDDDGDDGHEGPFSVEEAEKEEELGDMYDLMSRLVRNEAACLYWTTRRDSIDCQSLRKDQMTNHYANAATFTTKVGLCVNLQNLQWFDTADPDSFFPRCYRLGAQDEKQAFIEDFRRTACTSLLQYVVEACSLDVGDVQNAPTEHSVSETQEGGKRQRRPAARRVVAAGMIDKALHVCQEFLNSLDHGDIDITMETFTSPTGQQWEEFLHDYYLVVHGRALIQGGMEFVERCQSMLTRLREVCPQLDTDGLHNIWIIKPGAMSRGRGIVCMNRLEDILTLVNSDSTLIKDSKWVVQKYLERPLLVHNTKFDIRQWFLVTDWNPLTIWFYKECYLRFSTQPYTTTSLDSSVHLCNNSIQKHFQPSEDRHPGVPVDNMWSCSQFRTYLQERGLGGSQWGAVVVPGMQQAVIRTMRTAQDLVEGRKASFELYGADFMLGRDLRPWLLEINSSPTMACSSAVTARLCPAVQLDTLRVVLDWRNQPAAYTGGFQLIYRQAAVEVPHYVGTNLLVEGAPLRPVQSRPAPRKHSNLSNRIPANPTSVERSPSDVPKTMPTTDGQPSFKSKAASAAQSSGKTTHSAGEKKTPLPSARSREHEGRTLSSRTPGLGRRSYHRSAPEGPVVLNTEPWQKARHLGLTRGHGGVPLVPRTLFCSLDPSVGHLPEAKPQTKKVGFEPQSSRTYILQRALKPHRRALAQGLPSLSGPLPALEVFSLRPNSLSCERSCPPLYSHHSLHMYKLSSHRQTLSHNTMSWQNIKHPIVYVVPTE
ncbi:hypothetical protein NHX12_029615 [Muraenolepis orangiensis]|uniref:Tubulin monoglycylase TTLL3-like n=1 Tax=Muraenolepis orangiensis TaxID=630683 RepID=A0A9Q0E8M5_9TELE|nr:hypothetical protein NHX12_029615 [Muraenolepis orangiensis]